MFPDTTAMELVLGYRLELDQGLRPGPGVPHLAIVLIFHVRDQMGRAENRRGPFLHVVSFYAWCLAIGYGLFQCLPQAYAMAGFGYVESTLVVAAAINLHHFIVDAYIWKLRADTGNRRIIGAEPA